MMFAWLRFVPKNHLSALVGVLAGVRLPRPFSTWLVRLFAWWYRIDVTEASKPLSEYGSIAEFFVRDLRPGCRPLPADRDTSFLSPVDGRLRGAGPIAGLHLEQIKGKSYAVEDLLFAEKEIVERYSAGTFYNIYLAPTNYHQVHSPVSGCVVSSTYVPGKLWPVNDWSLESISNLFAVNERIVTYIESEKFGLVAVVMVGATNVGAMSVAYDNWRGNAWPWTRISPLKPETRRYDSDIQIRAGEKLGVFHLGSTVIVLVERGGGGEIAARAVRMGERLE